MAYFTICQILKPFEEQHPINFKFLRQVIDKKGCSIAAVYQFNVNLMSFNLTSFHFVP